jgi:UPF0755 protein
VNALLDPSNRSASSRLLVPEGATSLDVAASVLKSYGTTQTAASIAKALASADLRESIPVNYKAGTATPKSIEGFLYPATYTFDPTKSPADTLASMVSAFITEDRSSGFAAAATKMSLTPYQALIIASIAQSEAKFPEDMPKVARTILNRIAKNKPLQFDSTSSYACKLAGTTNCIYDKVESPYNTYTHSGLPPTPIDNPGAEAMKAAVTPAKGNWMYFVNKDKAGHLFFTNSETLFEKARLKCVKNNWGCG